MRDKFGEDAGYATAKETLECLPVHTVNRQPTSYNYPSFAHELSHEDAHNTPLLSSNKRKYMEKLDKRANLEDHYATARSLESKF